MNEAVGKRELICTIIEDSPKYQKMMASIDIGNDAIETSQHVTCEFSDLVHVVTRIIKAYYSGVDIVEWFRLSASTIRGAETLIKCQWSSDGLLKVIEDPAKKKYRHAITPAECMGRYRNFTCTRATYGVTPKRKVSTGKRGKDGVK